ETQRYQETLTKYEYRAPANNPLANPHLLLDRVKYPDTRLPDGNVLTDIVQQYTDQGNVRAYDDRGRLLRSVDPEDIETRFEYFPDGVKEGYLKKKTIDPTGLAITTGYEVNEIGIPTTIIHPRAAGVTDGRFRTRVDVNALNQVIRTVTSPP